MSLSAIAICSRALLKIGTQALSSFDDGTVESEIALNLYPGVRDTLLSLHPWSFATAQKRLPRLLGKPLSDFEYAYQLPADFLRALSLGHGQLGRGMRYQIQEKRIHTNADEAVLKYIFRPQEVDFPPYFTQCLINFLAAEFCLPLTESSTRAEGFRQQAEKDLKQIRNIDSQQQTARHLDLDALITIRY